MNAFIRVGSALFLVVCAMASRAREPGPTHSFGRLAGTLADQVGGRWEEREGILFGSDAKEDGMVTFACTVLPNLTAYPDAVPAWEYRVFYCNAPCHILAASDRHVLAAPVSDLAGALEKIAGILGAAPVRPSRAWETYVQEEYGLVAGRESMKLLRE